MNVQTITTTPEAQKSFYPTPPGLVDKLLAGIDWDYIETVLEPSVGKGDLVKTTMPTSAAIMYNDRKLDVDCVEIDPYLHSILEHESKESEQVYIVHDNFLTFQSRKRYDLIIMNPPFADGDAHLLKAIELQKRWGGQIRCLLNA